jgi:hypothetical protein
MTSNAEMASRIEQGRRTGYYEKYRETMQGMVDAGYSTRRVAAEMRLSRSTVIVASRVLGIVFDASRNLTIAQQERRTREYLKKTAPERLPSQMTPTEQRTLVDIIRAYQHSQGIVC